MIKCAFNAIEASDHLAEALFELSEGDAKLSEIMNEIASFLNDFVLNLYIIEDINEVSSIIIDTANDLGLLGKFPKIFDANRINRYVEDIKSGNKVNPDILDTSTENIEEPEQVRRRKDASIRFLDNMYGLARNVRDYFVAQHDKFLFDALFINRGSLDDDGRYLEMAQSGPTMDDNLLNANIKEYLELLWTRIKDFLMVLKGLPADVLYKINHKSLYEEVPDGYGGNKYVYTGILEDIASTLQLYLSVEVMSDGKGAFLRELFKDAFGNKNTRKRQQLLAYFAYHILNNFDSYLTNKLGKSIDIQYFNLLHGDNKYKIAKSTSNLLTTWRDNEEINVEDEADKVTKLLISTTPVHAWGEWRDAIGGQYLHFNDFESIISKIKDIAFNPESSGILFDDDFKVKKEEIWNTFSDYTKELIKGKNLREIVTMLRQNPRKYSQVVFDILTSELFYDNYKDKIYKGYSKDERNKLWTIGTQIFGIVKPELNSQGNPTYRYHNTNSIYHLAKHQSTNDYYGYITQTVDSIFKVDYIQYYKDPRTGLIYGRTLYDSTLYKRLREVSEGIRIANSSKRSKSLKLWEESLQLKRKNISTSDKEGKPIEIFLGIEFVIPNSNVTVKVSKSTGDVRLYNEQGALIDSLENLKNDPAINDFIKQTLRIDLLNNPEFLPNLAEVGNGEDNVFEGLINMAARSTMLKYVGYAVKVKEASVDNQNNSNVINSVDGDPETTINKIFGDKSNIKYNWNLNEIDTIHPLDVILMKNIALTKSNLSGDATASVLRDGKGNALSKNTLSRLLGSVLSQWDLIERQSDSATKDSIILKVQLNENGDMESVFEGVYTAKEFDSSDSNKEMRQFTVAEMATSNFFFDYIAGLNTSNRTKESPDDLVGNGIVMFLPSVNSDKNTIGRIKINLNYKVDIDGQKIRFRDLNTSQIKRVIAKEFGDVYVNILNKVNADLGSVDEIILKNYPELAVSLKNGYKDNFKAFNQAFLDYKNAKDEKGRFLHPNFAFTDPVSFIKALVTDYNSKTNKPIELIDLVHYNAVTITDPYTDKLIKGLGFNQTLISQIARFSPGKAGVLGISYSNYPSSDKFFKTKNKEFLRSALKSKFRISYDKLLPSSDIGKTSDIEYLMGLDSQKGWFDRSGKMVLAKYHVSLEIDGKTYDQVFDITSEADLYKSHFVYEYKENGSRENVRDAEGRAVTFNIGHKGGFEDFFEDPATIDALELNPELEKYNLFDYLFSQSFMNATVGSFIAHPAKGSFNNVLEEEAARFLAQHKRNVLFTAAMHEFQLNTLNGIPEEYNIAVIEDIHDEQHTFGGESNDIKPFDGATYVNPFVVYLENYSLGGAKAGITKKQFVHFKNGSTGTSGIIKTAGFGMTNDWIRNSEMMLRMMKKMTDRVWRDADGNELHNLNIFEKYDGTPLTYPKIFTKVGNQFFEHYLEYNNLTGTYTRYTREVNSQGEWSGIPTNWQSSEELTIDSNYKLWEAFGGMNSASLVNGFLQYSDDSVTSVVKAMNNVGISKNTGRLETQDDVYQILKHSDIHYVPTAGAVKLGAANINSASKFYDDNSKLDYQVIKMYQAGIQLDKEHHADDAELSLMTLVISACASKGFTYEQAVGIYDALARANELNLDDHYEALQLYLKGDVDSLREVVLETIIDNLGNSLTGNGNFAEIISRKIVERAKKGEKILFANLVLPLSDNTVYSKIFSIITSYLTKSGIKQKIPGVLAVLSPSYDNYKLHNGKKRELFVGKTEEETLQNLRAELSKVIPHYSTEFKFDPNSDEFRGYPIVYQAEITEDVAIQDGVIYVNPGSVKAEFEKSKDLFERTNTGINFNDLIQFLNYRLLEETLKDKNGLSGEELKETAEHYLNNNSSDIDIDRTYHITFDKSKFHLDGNGNPAIYPAPDGLLVYVPLTEDFYNPNLDNCINVKASHWYIQTPKLYRELKKLIDSGLVSSVTEDIIEGRNLGSYNVRGTTASGKRFQIWDLDSANAAFELDANKKKINDKFIVKFSNAYLGTNYAEGTIFDQEFKDNWYQNAKIRINRWLQSDLANLSPSLESSIDQYNRFQEKLEEQRQQGVSELDLMNWKIAWANVKQGRNDGILYRIGDTLVPPTEDNWQIINDAIYLDILNSNKVRIGGVLEEVDKSTLKLTAYEIIMPKRFKSAFSLDNYADLNTISKNPDYFLEEYANKSHLQIDDPKQFTIALKHSDGNHVYVLDRSLMPANSGLHRLGNIVEDIIDGKRIRLDAKGNEMYPMQKAGDGVENDDEIWIDGHGHEVIVTDNVLFYLETQNCDDLLLSSTLSSEATDSIIRTLEKVDKRVISRFLRYITKGGRLNVIDNFDEIMYNNNDIITQGTMHNDKYIHIAEAMREKHTSFLRSLDIVAARIPAQSMQSFMPMKVVAFENPDLNNAYVSTMQILLQGSDYK